MALVFSIESRVLAAAKIYLGLDAQYYQPHFFSTKKGYHIRFKEVAKGGTPYIDGLDFQSINQVQTWAEKLGIIF